MHLVTVCFNLFSMGDFMITIMVGMRVIYVYLYLSHLHLIRKYFKGVIATNNLLVYK